MLALTSMLPGSCLAGNVTMYPASPVVRLSLDRPAPAACSSALHMPAASGTLLADSSNAAMVGLHSQTPHQLILYDLATAAYSASSRGLYDTDKGFGDR